MLLLFLYNKTTEATTLLTAKIVAEACKPHAEHVAFGNTYNGGMNKKKLSESTHKHKHTHTHTNTQTHKHTNTQTQTHVHTKLRLVAGNYLDHLASEV